MPLSDDQLQAKEPMELVTLAIEEAAEVIQAAVKCQRFGIDGVKPNGTPWEDGNGVALCREGESLGAICRILGAKLGMNYAEIVSHRHKAAAKQTAEFGEL